VDFSRTVKFSRVNPGDAHGPMLQAFPIQQIAEHLAGQPAGEIESHRVTTQFPNGPGDINTTPTGLIRRGLAPEFPFGHDLIHCGALVDGRVHRQGGDFHGHTFFL